MPRCTAEPAQWKGRSAFRLANGTIEITMLFGGGHIADLRPCHSPVNALFEAPWKTIEPQTFSSRQHAQSYGEGSVGKLLSGYTGHAVALGYFGLPGINQALPLHGEAVAAVWRAESARADDREASATFAVTLPTSGFRFHRKINLAAGSFFATIEESLQNLSGDAKDFQWVEHAAFGPPLLEHDDARLHLSAQRGITWPLGYEGHELLPDNREFTWPHITAIDGAQVDLANPLYRAGTGFVASLLADNTSDHAFIAVHNRRLQLLAGYVYPTADFPWIALWEENGARDYSPWNGTTRVRGVEFGNTPMPLGLDHARKNPTLLNTPTFAQIAGRAQITKAYRMFVCPAEESAIESVGFQATLLIRAAGRSYER